MNAEKRSFWGLAARASLPWVLGLGLLMTIAEAILFRVLGWKAARLEYAVQDAYLYLVFTLALANLSIALCNRSLFGAGSAALQRLRLDGRGQFRLLAAQNALCALVLWAWQTALALALCLWWCRAHPDMTGAHTIFVASWRVGFLHALLPLSDWPLWVRNIVLCAVIGVCTAKGAITRKTVWPIVICCVGAAFFPTGMGMEAPVLIELAFLLFAGFMSYAFGKEGPADEEA